MDKNNPANKKRKKVKVYTNNLEIIGQITMSTESYRSRTLDMLNDGKAFLAVTDAEIYALDGKFINKTTFIAINKQAITILMEVDEENEVLTINS